jgi:hypothetical protein
MLYSKRRRVAIVLPCVFLLEMMSAKLRVTVISQHRNTSLPHEVWL